MKLYRVIVATGPPTRPLTWPEATREVQTLARMNREANARGVKPPDRLRPLRVVVDISTTPGAMPGAEQEGRDDRR
jgi:hypothetical protein